MRPSSLHCVWHCEQKKLPQLHMQVWVRMHEECSAVKSVACSNQECGTKSSFKRKRCGFWLRATFSFAMWICHVVSHVSWLKQGQSCKVLLILQWRMWHVQIRSVAQSPAKEKRCRLWLMCHTPEWWTIHTLYCRIKQITDELTKDYGLTGVWIVTHMANGKVAYEYFPLFSQDCIIKCMWKLWI